VGAPDPEPVVPQNNVIALKQKENDL
jgi:hypothetical protein